MKWIMTTPDAPWQTGTITENPSCSDRLTLTGKEEQTFEGFGGCFNELGWIALQTLEPEKQAEVLDALFSQEKGIGFTWGRIPIGASDYAASWYSLNEQQDDYQMEHFSISRDEQYLLPYIHAAQQIQPEMRFFASPWSPPTWMKEPPVYNYGRLKMEPQVLDSYCLYFEKFLKAYEEQGVKVERLHLQNEPFADQKFPSCCWSSEQFRVFIRDYIGPRFERDGVDTEIWLGTLNGPTEMDFGFGGIRLDSYDRYLDNILFDEEARKYLAGVGYQWNGQRVIHKTRKSFPELKLMQTENECGDGQNSWEYARYVFDLVRHYLENGVTAYCYWNMVLKPGGASTWGWRQNTLITIDPDKGDYLFNPEYYVMRHYAAVIQPGAVILEGSGHWSSSAIAARNPDGSVAVLVQNALDRERTFTFEGEGRCFTVSLAPRSMHSFLLP